jgi:hypothetical protein
MGTIDSLSLNSQILGSLTYWVNIRWNKIGPRLTVLVIKRIKHNSNKL